MTLFSAKVIQNNTPEPIKRRLPSFDKTWGPSFLFKVLWSDAQLMTTEVIIESLASEELPPTTMCARRLFGSFSLSSLPKPPPLSRLPNELLSLIFLSTTQNADDRFERILIPIVLSQVSARWRNVAIATGGLWNNIILTFPTSRQQLSRAVTWLKRSKLAPLDIFLDFRDPSWDWDLSESAHKFRWQDMEAILRLLMSHFHRWKRFELLTDTWAPIFTFLCYARRVKSVPTLESLSLQRCNAFFASKHATFAPVEMRQPVQLFGGHCAEKLREVALTGVHVDWSGLSSSPLRNLAKLELSYLANDVLPSMDQFISMLTECRELRHLTILGRGPKIDDSSKAASADHDATSERQSPSPKPPSVIKLTCVTDFVFGFIDTSYALRLLDMINLPALENLTLEDLTDLEPLALHDLDATPILEKLLPNTCPSESTYDPPFSLSCIRSLKLAMIHANTATFSRLFHELSALDFLGLYKTKIDAVHALAPTTSDGTSRSLPCAALKELGCQDMDVTALGDSILARGSKSRICRLYVQSEESIEDLQTKLSPAVSVCPQVKTTS
ncbi:hypothetical protein H0H93_008878 [Arthromyces matolae]|nr:hypothetical protein H0H93_008878 [Arthromyces matolae]